MTAEPISELGMDNWKAALLSKQRVVRSDRKSRIADFLLRNLRCREYVYTIRGIQNASVIPFGFGKLEGI
jgi:hypothetical protein